MTESSPYDQLKAMSDKQLTEFYLYRGAWEQSNLRGILEGNYPDLWQRIKDTMEKWGTPMAPDVVMPEGFKPPPPEPPHTEQVYTPGPPPKKPQFAPIVTMPVPPTKEK